MTSRSHWEGSLILKAWHGGGGGLKCVQNCVTSLMNDPIPVKEEGLMEIVRAEVAVLDVENGAQRLTSRYRGRVGRIGRSYRFGQRNRRKSEQFRTSGQVWTCRRSSFATLGRHVRWWRFPWWVVGWWNPGEMEWPWTGTMWGSPGPWLGCGWGYDQARGSASKLIVWYKTKIQNRKVLLNLWLGCSISF